MAVNETFEARDAVLLDLPNELLLQVTHKFNVEDLSSFRLANTRCAAIGHATLEEHLKCGILEPTLEVSFYPRDLEILSAMARSALAKYCFNVSFVLDDQYLSLASQYPPTSLQRIPMDLQSFQNLQSIRLSSTFWDLQTLALFKDRQELSQRTWPRWLELMRTLPTALETTVRQLSASSSRMIVALNALREPPSQVLREISRGLWNATDVEIIVDSSDFGGHRNAFGDCSWRQELYPKLAHVEKLVLRQAGPSCAYNCDVTHELMMWQPTPTSFFLPALRDLTLINIVVKAEHLESVCRILGPQLRSFLTSHVSLCYGLCIGNYCRTTGDPFRNPFFGSPGTYACLRHLTALHWLRIEVCKAYYRDHYMRPPRTQFPFTFLEPSTLCMCSMPECGGGDCWDIGNTVSVALQEHSV